MPRTNDSRERTVRAAAQLIGERGVAGTGLREVVAAAGTPRGSLTHHFPGGKDELVMAAVAWSASRLGDRLDELADSGEATIAGLLRMCMRWWEKGLLAANFVGGCAIAATVMDASLAEPDVRTTVTRAFAAWTDPIARIAQGEGLSPARARQFAMTTVAAIEGGLLLARASESLDPLRDVEASLLLLAEALRN